MDTSTQINNLLLQLDRAALALTTTDHPDVDLRLDIDCTMPGAAGIVDCAVTRSQSTAAGVEVILTPVHSHCVQCGAIYTIAPGAHDVFCPACASRQWVPHPNTV